MMTSAEGNLEQDMLRYRPFIEECFGGKRYTLEEVPGGRSFDIKAKAHCDGKDYMVKVIEGRLDREERNKNRIAWYQALWRIRHENPCVLGPLFYGMAAGRVVTITEWIEGEQLNEAFDKRPDSMVLFGKKAGRLLYELHHQEFVRRAAKSGGVSIAEKTARAVSELEQEIGRCGIDFRGMDRAMDYLKSNRAILSEERAGIVHNDIRPENFISAGGKLYIYDFDSGTIQDCFADFTYLSAISQEKYRPFSYAAIMSYYDLDIPEEFWKVNLYFSIIKLLDYAIYKYHKSGKRIVNQADNFVQLFHNYENPVPDWWGQIDEQYRDKL